MVPRGHRHGNTATPARVRAQTIIGACDESRRVLLDEGQSRDPTKASEHSAVPRLIITTDLERTTQDGFSGLCVCTCARPGRSRRVKRNYCRSKTENVRLCNVKVRFQQLRLQLRQAPPPRRTHVTGAGRPPPSSHLGGRRPSSGANRSSVTRCDGTKHGINPPQGRRATR